MVKFELTDIKKIVNGHTVHRIVCVEPFHIYKKGDLGGWVESEKNLSQFGKCWIADDAVVYNNGYVGDDAWVGNNARVFDNASILENAYVGEDAKIFEYATIKGLAMVFGKAQVRNFAMVYGNAEISSDAVIVSEYDYIIFKNNFSDSFRYFTYTASNQKWKVGCFIGTGKELIKAAYAKNKEVGKCYEAYVELVEKLRSATIPQTGICRIYNKLIKKVNIFRHFR